MPYTIQQIKAAAELSCFYVTPEGLWLRMQATDGEQIYAYDEDRGEEYVIPYSEITEEIPHFEMLMRTRIR